MHRLQFSSSLVGTPRRGSKGMAQHIGELNTGAKIVHAMPGELQEHRSLSGGILYKFKLGKRVCGQSLRKWHGIVRRHCCLLYISLAGPARSSEQIQYHYYALEGSLLSLTEYINKFTGSPVSCSGIQSRSLSTPLPMEAPRILRSLPVSRRLRTLRCKASIVSSTLLAI